MDGRLFRTLFLCVNLLFTFTLVGCVGTVNFPDPGFAINGESDDLEDSAGLSDSIDPSDIAPDGPGDPVLAEPAGQSRIGTPVAVAPDPPVFSSQIGNGHEVKDYVYEQLTLACEADPEFTIGPFAARIVLDSEENHWELNATYFVWCELKGPEAQLELEERLKLCEKEERSPAESLSLKYRIEFLVEEVWVIGAMGFISVDCPLNTTDFMTVFEIPKSPGNPNDLF